MTHEESTLVFSALMAECDKLIEQRRAEKRRRWNLSPDELRELEPLVIAVVYGARND